MTARLEQASPRWARRRACHAKPVSRRGWRGVQCVSPVVPAISRRSQPLFFASRARAGLSCRRPMAPPVWPVPPVPCRPNRAPPRARSALPVTSRLKREGQTAPDVNPEPSSRGCPARPALRAVRARHTWVLRGRPSFPASTAPLEPTRRCWGAGRVRNARQGRFRSVEEVWHARPASQAPTSRGLAVQHALSVQQEQSRQAWEGQVGRACHAPRAPTAPSWVPVRTISACSARRASFRRVWARRAWMRACRALPAASRRTGVVPALPAGTGPSVHLDLPSPLSARIRVWSVTGRTWTRGQVSYPCWWMVIALGHWSVLLGLAALRAWRTRVCWMAARNRRISWCFWMARSP